MTNSKTFGCKYCDSVITCNPVTPLKFITQNGERRVVVDWRPAYAHVRIAHPEHWTPELEAEAVRSREATIE